MTTYAADEDGATVCIDCLHGGCVAGGRWCEAEHCQCECQNRLIADDTERARALDDRPPAALESLARDMEAEQKPDYQALRRERFAARGWPRRGAA